jgi:hypothetical protein
MTPYKRQLLVTIALAGFSGFAGVWLGTHEFHPESTSPAPLRLAVDELTRRGLAGLTQSQKARIDDIEIRYSNKRRKLRSRIAAANSQLADALAVEMRLGPKVESSIDDLKGIVGELQHETVAYVLELRSVMSDQQQVVFDEKVVAALMTPPS